MYSIRRSPVLQPARMLAVAGVALLASPALSGGPIELPDALSEAIAAGPLKSVEDLRLLQRQVRKVVEAGRPVTVAVELDDSVGSGVIISGDGLVLTAGHVCAEPNRKVWVRFPDNRRVEGRSLGVNHRLDSGLVRITDKPPSAEGDDSDEASAWPFVPLAESDALPGDWVVGLGQPNGFVEGRTPPVRLGRVLYTKDDMINTDATLVGGDSGGPLLNLRGEVIGIHSKIGEKLSSNYHVPVAAYRREWDRLLTGRLTGVPDGEDPDDWRPQLGLAVRSMAERVVVTQVFAERAADSAGVQAGDVLLKLDGNRIESPTQLSRLVAQREAFDRLPLLIERAGVEVELEVWLGRASVDYPGAALVQEGQ